MKPIAILATTALLGLFAPAASAQTPARYVSLQQEIRQSIARANAWLLERQQENGHWDDEGTPAFTALALNSLARDPAFDPAAPPSEAMEKGLSWLLAQQKDDGGIYNRGLSVYNTAVSVTALMATGREEFHPAVARARRHLIGQQWGVDEEDPNHGGIGYGSNDSHTDLSNTYLAIEALALSRQVVEDGQFGEQPDLDWEAAIRFLSRCQNLEQTNDLEWASDDPDNRGGFIYTPGESKAGEQELPDGGVALRSYGSMSYAGLLSMIYARVSADDPRVVAVTEWLGRNYRVDENPGLGAQGLYYYYQTMSKALTVANISTLTLEDGREADWRNDLASKLLSAQREDGSWVNDNGRWMESNPVLVTAYTVLALAQVYDSIPR